MPAERWSNRALWRLCWPLVIEQLLAVTIGLVATIMVTAVGEAAVSGVSLVDTLNQLLITLFSALATGGAVVTSQYLGRRDRENASLAARQLIYAVALVALGVTAVALAARDPLLVLIYGNIAPDVMEAARIYMLYSALSFPFMALYNSGAALFRSMGNSKMGMLVSLGMNVLNIGLSLLFVFGLGMGVAGAALSTLISRAAASAAIMVLLLNRRSGPLSFKGILRIRLVFPMIRRILRIGVPNGLENSIFQVGKLMTARLTATFGTAAIAGNAIANTVSSFVTIPGSAVSLALLTVVGQCAGALDFDGAKRYTAKLMKVIIGLMTGVCLLALALSGPIVGMFGLSGEAALVARQCLLIFCIAATVIWPLSFAFPNALRAAGDARYTMVVSIGSMWVFRVGLSYLLAGTLGLGVPGIWLAMVTDWVVRSIFFVLRWRGGKWQEKRLIG